MADDETLRRGYEADLRNGARRAGRSGWVPLGRMPDGTYRRTDLEADYQTFKASMLKGSAPTQSESPTQ